MMTGEPTLDDVASEFPGWTCWREHYRYHASTALANGTVVTVHGEDPIDLRDQIIRAESERGAAGTP